eukprot:2753995-Alexandrium_andersonii.AAC.1
MAPPPDPPPPRLRSPWAPLAAPCGALDGPTALQQSTAPRPHGRVCVHFSGSQPREGPGGAAGEVDTENPSRLPGFWGPLWRVRCALTQPRRMPPALRTTPHAILWRVRCALSQPRRAPLVICTVARCLAGGRVVLWRSTAERFRALRNTTHIV